LAVAKDSPADKAGVRPQDYITQISREQNSDGSELATPETISTKDLSLEESVEKLRGRPGTRVKLTLRHENEDKTENVEFVRATDIIGVPFKELEEAAYNQTSRQYYQGRTVRIRGQFQPREPRIFSLVRLKITCCAADAIPLNVVTIIDAQSKTTAEHIKPMQWVEVTGRIQFRKRLNRDEFVTVLIVPSGEDIKTTDPDPNVYIQ
jgi:uncharacterized membrane protein YcgQ (UPF0703/DUF1980 family)